MRCWDACQLSDGLECVSSVKIVCPLTALNYSYPICRNLWFSNLDASPSVAIASELTEVEAAQKALVLIYYEKFLVMRPV